MIDKKLEQYKKFFIGRLLTYEEHELDPIYYILSSIDYAREDRLTFSAYCLNNKTLAKQFHLYEEEINGLIENKKYTGLRHYIEIF